MTVKEFYDSIGADYDLVMKTLLNDAFALRMLKKFLEDKNYGNLIECVNNGDIKGSFIACHTLKGVAANIGLNRLYLASSELTEQLRGLTNQADKDLLAKVTKEYNEIVEIIKTL